MHWILAGAAGRDQTFDKTRGSRIEVPVLSWGQEQG